ncbi:MAG: NrpR regulatory domain-containing protein [Thermodesulfobacteriota bacterium]
MDITSQRKIVSILKILTDAGKPLGGTRIAAKLQDVGIDLSQRMVRNYLQRMDQNGLTQNLGKKGRRITPKGEEELKSAFVIEKVGFVASKIDNLTYQMDFSLRKKKGKIILNISSIDIRDIDEAIHQVQLTFRAGLGMGRFVVLGFPGSKVGNGIIGGGKVAISTVCSVTINGILLNEGIHTTSRFGGLLELVEGRPFRFTEIINYDGSSIDPLEIFIKGSMTSVREAVLTGNGKIGASFREVPSMGMPRIEMIRKRLDIVGLGGIMMIGKPGRPLLDIPVSEGRVGMIVAGGLNPIAAVEESGIATENVAMGSLFEFEQLVPFWELNNAVKNF